MILVTNGETGMPAYIFVKEIAGTERTRANPPLTRVRLKDPKQGHEYFLDVTESIEEISRRIKEERHIPGEEAKEHDG